MINFITKEKECQEALSEKFKTDMQKKLVKLQKKKVWNEAVINWLIQQRTQKETEIAYEIYQCATYIEFADVSGSAKISGANFCRNRVCNVCAWRRQAKFLSQITPILEEASSEGYEFLFATLTIKNTPKERLGETLDVMMKAYNKFLGRKKVQTSFMGAIRSVEITYNPTEQSYHPHIHILIAVKPDYFFNSDKYISQQELTNMWKKSLDVEYTPVCHIEKVSNSKRAEVETIKYALKPSQYEEALEGFYYSLKGRRLISFSGIFSKYRKDFEKEQNGELLEVEKSEVHNTIAYRFDPTGGIYKFLETYKKENESYEEFLRICRTIENVTDNTDDFTADNGAIIRRTKVHI